jgi:hypothetical protein
VVVVVVVVFGDGGVVLVVGLLVDVVGAVVRGDKRSDLREGILA